MKKYRIVAITQIYNEIRKGHLERFFKYLPSVVDEIVIYDDASTDGSFEYAQKFTKHVIRGRKNDFANELQHKQIMLDKALSLKPDFILSIDADEVVTDNDGSKLQNLADWVIEGDLDGAVLHDINLWRNVGWARTDSDFDSAWFSRFWRVKPGMSYGQPKTGLHQSPAPETVRKVKKTDIACLLHFGFATDRSIAAKYLTYARYGQKGPNLSRLIDESNLKLRPVDKNFYPDDLWVEEARPQPHNLVEWIKLLQNLKEELLKPSVSIVALIYKSTDWLKFCYEQVLKYTDMRDKEFFFVANDATEDVKAYLKDNYIPHYLFNNTDEQKKEWYINNVYRAWNFGGQKAHGDYILFINSDMAFTPNWVEDLFANLDGHNCVCSRLVESGKLSTGGTNIERDFGKLIEEFDEPGFQTFAKQIKEQKLVEGGAFMPLLIKKDYFLKAEGYPEGNIRPGSDIFNPAIVQKGEALISGDIVLMKKLKTLGIKHTTAYNSVVYHFQEGEMTSIAEDIPEEKKVEVVVANNSLTGAMGEKVMWNFLLENLPHTAPVDIKKISSEENFELKAKEYIKSNFGNAKIILQNASFIDLIDPNLITVAFLQDNLRAMNKMSIQQETNLEQASFLVANSFDTAASYPEFYFDIIPIGVNTELFKPGNKEQIRNELGIEKGKVGIFVGDLTEVKGWSKIKDLINQHQEITWLVVSKGEGKYAAPNVKMYNRISQEKLARLYKAADFFILGSPVETLCLAAMEACFCGIPVIMNQVGIFMNFSPDERDSCGIFGEDFELALSQIYERRFSPREILLEKKVDIKSMVDMWWSFLTGVKMITFGSHTSQLSAYSVSKRKTLKKKIFMTLMNKNYLNTYFRRKMPMPIYRLSLYIWRSAVKIKKRLYK